MLDAPKKDPLESKDCAALSINALTKKMHLPRFVRYAICNRLDRDRCRAPMAWDKEGGFTSGTPWLPYAEDDGLHNVKSEEIDAKSILNFYKTLLKLRQEHDSLTLGDFDPLPVKAPIFAYRRHYQNADVLVLVNLSKKSVKLPQYLCHIEGKLLLQSQENEDASVLPSYAVRIYRLAE